MNLSKKMVLLSLMVSTLVLSSILNLNIVNAAISSDEVKTEIPSKNGVSSISDFANGVTINEKNVSLYDVSGTKLNRTLDLNTDWKTDLQNVINGKIYYRVSTNEFVEGEKVILYKNSAGKIKITAPVSATLYDRGDNKLSRSLPKDSIWYTDRFVMINGAPIVRVATNEYVQTGDFEAVN